MIEPFEPGQVRHAEDGRRIVSYGTSSYGYDIRCAPEFKVFTNIYSTVVDPKNFDEKSFVDIEADVCIIPPNSFALARTLEYFRIPRNVLTICLGKSTYARCGIIVNVTPFEPEWEGYVTLEFSNTTPLPAKIYAGEGCAQVVFFESDEVCETSYKDRGGKYQGQQRRDVAQDLTPHSAFADTRGAFGERIASPRPHPGRLRCEWKARRRAGTSKTFAACGRAAAVSASAGAASAWAPWPLPSSPDGSSASTRSTLLGMMSGGGGGQVIQQPQARPRRRRATCRRKFVSQVLRSTEVVWTDVFRQAGRTYQLPKLVLFKDGGQPAAARSGRDGSVLLPERPEGLHRPRASSTCWRGASARRAVRPGLRR